jgi:hypothetical protein
MIALEVSWRGAFYLFLGRVDIALTLLIGFVCLELA